MRNTITISAIILLVMAGCGGGNQSTDELITVDMTTTSYSPKKELIIQDLFDVEYIPLETNDEFLTQGFVQDVGKDIIVMKNYNSDGNIYMYDRTGKALRVINRKGGGNEEYTSPFGIKLDERNQEMFVNDIYARKIMVYDLYGNYKRTLKHKEGNGTQFYTDIFDYDNDNLICHDPYNEEIAFVLISKQDGSITHEIKLPFKEKKYLQQRSGDMTVSPGPSRSIIPHNGKWMLAEFSCDTVYTFLPDYSLQPSIARTPSIQSMEPGIFLRLRCFSDRYYFMETVKNVFDFDTQNGFPQTYLMYDKQEKAFFGYTVYNGDYSTQKEMYMSMARPVNHDIESWLFINADKLTESYEKGELTGRLKEMAAGLEEDANPVIMLLKHKKP